MIRDIYLLEVLVDVFEFLREFEMENNFFFVGEKVCVIVFRVCRIYILV